jgi:hypothetical protein
MKTQRITGDAGMFFAVAVPSESYRAHVGRIEKALDVLGYDAVPLTGEDIIRAENVERLRQQIERVDGELRSLAVQRRAFVAALEALDAEQNPRVTTQHVTPEH